MCLGRSCLRNPSQYYLCNNIFLQKLFQEPFPEDLPNNKIDKQHMAWGRLRAWWGGLSEPPWATAAAVGPRAVRGARRWGDSMGRGWSTKYDQRSIIHIFKQNDNDIIPRSQGCACKLSQLLFVYQKYKLIPGSRGTSW